MALAWGYVMVRDVMARHRLAVVDNAPQKHIFL